MGPLQMLNHDDTIVSGGGSAEALPAVDPGFGFGVAFGGRSKNGGEIDLSYIRTSHPSDQADGFDVTFSSIDVGWRIYRSAEKRLQPFVMVSAGINRARVDSASVSATATEDAVFSGFNIQLGGGVSYLLARNISVFVEAAYRFGKFRRVEGVADGPLEDPIKSRGIRVSPGLTLRFPLDTSP